jgi:murein L,D-transpeptidase YafK
LIAFAIAAAATVAVCENNSRLEPAPGEQLADRVVVVKSARTLTLYAKGKVLKSYKVALGGVPSGPKQFQGDHKTPEGEYILDQKNANSRFHLALHVSYPNAADRLRAKKAGRDPGGAIMVHGLPRGYEWLGSQQSRIDWTEGCIAVSNPEIEEIWRLVPVGTPIEIKP